MRITSRFTIAVHILTAVEYFSGSMTVTGRFLAGSIGANPVIVRALAGKLRDAGFLNMSQGKSGITLAKPLNKITFYDVYKIADSVDETGLFHFHENPNILCPVGRNIHKGLDGKLQDVQKAMEDKMRGITLADVMADTLRAIENEDKN
ncbi:MAG: Rrf2 family transcriptional regulator [Firmicutes bacterium]|nr:Rrf2 family transcriptional regulator [Bacillota bacterium]MBR0105250.1 Rrf2 family transcriptional regulator [Bacillota bacterium]MBR2593109.1 Rrf2 family transcriptional regulator [Bacillota bacterium]